MDRKWWEHGATKRLRSLPIPHSHHQSWFLCPSSVSSPAISFSLLRGEHLVGKGLSEKTLHTVGLIGCL